MDKNQLKKEAYEFDFNPVDSKCTCKVCTNYSRSYLRHLYKAKEILFAMLATYHNLYFLQNLIQNARIAIENNSFISFKKKFLQDYGEEN